MRGDIERISGTVERTLLETSACYYRQVLCLVDTLAE
jgi:hypothetical protein